MLYELQDDCFDMQPLQLYALQDDFVDFLNCYLILGWFEHISLLMGDHLELCHFIDRIRQYNSCFQMTSFGAKQIADGFMLIKVKFIICMEAYYQSLNKISCYINIFCQ